MSRSETKDTLNIAGFEQVVQVENKMKFGRMSVGGLNGRHPWWNEDLDKTGAKVFAVARDGEVLVTFDEHFELQTNNVLFVCGLLKRLERCQRRFDATTI